MAHSPLSVLGLRVESVLIAVAKRHGLPATVVPTWNVQRSVVPVPCSVDPEHIVANRRAVRLELTTEDCVRITTLNDPELKRFS